MSDSTPPAQPGECELCGRSASGLTRHHLIPRSRHRNRATRRRFGREALRNRILWVCRPCHSHIHRTLAERELAAEFHTRERLLRHPEIRRFVDWLSDKPAGFKPKAPVRRR
ncbi:MAG: hypothetical protein PVH31_08225 [Ectothiorhodospiraceae bacterium]|jgi:5-methylcytosine-specific restriction endonuclease McrA